MLSGPTHKLIIVGNHKPEITDTSFGMWRRVALIPFDQTIAEAKRDPRLLETLKERRRWDFEYPAHRLGGLPTGRPAASGEDQAATAAYRDEQDVLGDWIAEKCDAGPGRSIQKRSLYADYVLWTGENGHRPFSQSKLTRRLNGRGYQLAADKRTVTGISLKRERGLAHTR